MLDISHLLLSVLGFTLTISFLVAIHEYGHFWVARKFGVKIEKFSIGFGKPIVKWYGKRDNTEYSIAWIPLGGYVKMYGENPAEVDASIQTTDHDSSDISDIGHFGKAGSFSALPAIKRFLIAFAGPAVNLLFAILALWFLFILGVPDLKPYVGRVVANSIFAQAGIQRGAEIIAVDNKETKTLTDTAIYLVDHLGQTKVSITTIDSSGLKQTTTVDLSRLPVGSELHINQALGFNWQFSEATENLPASISQVVANSPADKAGLQVADHITRVNGKIIRHWQGFVDIIRANANQPLTLTVNRHGAMKQLKLTPAPNPNNAAIGYAGVAPEIPDDLFAQYRTVKRFGFFEALPMAVRENYLQAKLTLKTIGRIISGRASIKNMGGPLTIADYSGQTLKAGYVSYLKFLAAISLTLAVMNLLPVPVLDGGHMALYGIEMVRGKPVSQRTAELLLRIGMSVLLTFMLIVISVDLWKYLLE
ncbi:MAG: RIP metalloprotease RseP [Gammaproteobacteria bacterium]|nr:MAG: RIP metalloprotease RseP [Gammaproteobacteria bacterium]